ALAALLILAVRPNDLADPGFQLSFAATAGIVLAPLPRGLVWGSLGVSIAAQLAVLPIALWHFNQLSAIGPIANLGVVPLAGLAHLVVAVTIGAWPLVRPPDGRLRLTVLDVGQGDAIVIQAPDGRTVVVDAGPGGGMRLDTGARVLAPFLWNHGVLQLAGLVTTHDDQDHAGGSAALRREFTIGD